MPQPQPQPLLQDLPRKDLAGAASLLALGVALAPLSDKVEVRFDGAGASVIPHLSLAKAAPQGALVNDEVTPPFLRDVIALFIAAMLLHGFDAFTLVFQGKDEEPAFTLIAQKRGRREEVRFVVKSEDDIHLVWQGREVVMLLYPNDSERLFVASYTFGNEGTSLFWRDQTARGIAHIVGWGLNGFPLSRMSQN